MSTSARDIAIGHGAASTGPLKLHREGPVLWITFNRPERLNASTAELEDRLLEACALADDDADVRVVVLQGASGKRHSFMAGGDISEFAGLHTSEEVVELEERSERVLCALEGLRVPIIGSLDGAVIGQGALIAACCDVLVAGPDVKFGFPIARTVGNLLSTKGLRRLVDLVGLPATRTLLMRAVLFGTDDLLTAGAITATASSHDGLAELTRNVANEIAELAPLTVTLTKSSLREVSDPAADNTALVVRCYLSDDAREAQRAFFEKRPPVWSGR